MTIHPSKIKTWTFKSIHFKKMTTTFSDWRTDWRCPDWTASQYQYWARQIASIISVLIQSLDHVTFYTLQYNCKLWHAVYFGKIHANFINQKLNALTQKYKTCKKSCRILKSFQKVLWISAEENIYNIKRKIYLPQRQIDGQKFVWNTLGAYNDFFEYF